MRTGGLPSFVSIFAPISLKGFAARSIGRFMSELSPMSSLLKR
jgi:hypothetical protein